MNIDDYVNHIRKKYRLALAVAIIHNKPDHITTQEYIEHLRNNIENETSTDFDEISISSKEFMYEYDPGIANNKEINKTNEQNKETTLNFKENNNDYNLDNTFLNENSSQDGKLDNATTTELNRVENNKTGLETNNSLDKNHEKLMKPVTGQFKPISTLVLEKIDLNKTNNSKETHDNIESPDILQNFNLKHATLNTQAVYENDLHNEASNKLETHNNMNSPNILENFDIELAIKAHAIDRNETGVDKDVFEVEDDGLDSRLRKQSHVNDKTQSKTRNIGSFITKQTEQAPKPNFIIEDSQLIDISDTDSNITDCEIANNSIDNITDEINNNNVNNVVFNTQTTFCDQNTQLETIDLININECNIDGSYRNKKQTTIEAKDLQSNSDNFKEDLNLKSKTKDEFKILNKDFNKAVNTKSKYEEHNKLKRKLNEPNETITNINMLSQINRVEINEEDSQATELYTIQGFSQPLSHISQSQIINTYNIDPKHIQKAKQQKTSTKDILEEVYVPLSPDIAKAKQQKTISQDILKTDNVQLSLDIAFQDNTQDFDYNNINMAITETNFENTSKDYHSINVYEDLCNSYKEQKNIGQKNETFKTKNTLEEALILTNKHKNINSSDVTEYIQNYVPKTNSKNINYETNKAYNYNKDKSYITKTKDNITYTEKQIQEKLNEHTANINYTAGLVTGNINENNNYEINKVNSCNTVSDKSYITKTKDSITNTENTADFNNTRLVIGNTKEISLDIQEEASKDAEVIPFKVIEEMNRVKVYLSRNNDRRVSVDGVSADSGFFSDSQIKSSLQLSSQSSQNWLNQSAHSLLDYLLNCPLLATNMEFTEEISVVLCDLIDKLHVEETYPPFLDLILEKIELFLEEISCGYDEELGSRTEQLIHRFLLLNKSINIIKYTLEKLTKILEKIHENLTKTDPYYEISNTNETQNISYIFHLLEILIKRFLKQKDGLGSQNTQPSENLTKKTCITDIWRAKWNSKFKPFKELPSSCQIVKEDVTERLAVILNKIIISCMEAYSLVSFAALQCFNVLQS